MTDYLDVSLTTSWIAGNETRPGDVGGAILAFFHANEGRSPHTAFCLPFSRSAASLRVTRCGPAADAQVADKNKSEDNDEVCRTPFLTRSIADPSFVVTSISLDELVRPSPRERRLPLASFVRQSSTSPRSPRFFPSVPVLFASPSPSRRVHFPLRPSIATPVVRAGQLGTAESRFPDPRPHRPRSLQLPYPSRRLRHGGLRGAGATGRFETKGKRSDNDDELHEAIPVEASRDQLWDSANYRIGRHSVRSDIIRLLPNRRNLSLFRRRHFPDEFAYDDAEGREHGSRYVQSRGGTFDAGRGADGVSTSIARFGGGSAGAGRATWIPVVSIRHAVTSESASLQPRTLRRSSALLPSRRVGIPTALS